MIEEKHIQIIRHSLGIDGLRWYDVHKIEQEPYRNYFASNEYSRDFPLLQDLVESGLMYQHKKEMFGEVVFQVTEEGIQVAKDSALEKANETRPTISKRRYQCYLHCECEVLLLVKDQSDCVSFEGLAVVFFYCNQICMIVY